MSGGAVQDEAGDDGLWPGLSGSDEQGPFLHGSRCAACGHVMLGRRARCTRCWEAGRIEALALGREGRVYSRTVIHAAPAGYVGPYTVGYVDLPEGIRVFAHLASGADAAGIGEAVRLEIVPLRKVDGADRTGPRYRRTVGGQP